MPENFIGKVAVGYSADYTTSGYMYFSLMFDAQTVMDRWTFKSNYERTFYIDKSTVNKIVASSFGTSTITGKKVFITLSGWIYK